MARSVEDDPSSDASRAPGRVLLVDDQPELRRLFRRSLSKAGFAVVDAASASAAIVQVKASHFDVVISDVCMPDMSGLVLLRALRELDPDLPVVLTSGSPHDEACGEPSEDLAFAYLVKPVSFDVMRETARRAVELRRARSEQRAAFEPYASVERLRVPRPPRSDDR